MECHLPGSIAIGIKLDILSFEAGWIDELVEPRTTAVNHGRGCRRIENMISLPQGPAITRPPSRYIASTKGHGAARLIKVVYSDVYAYLCEFGAGYVRFFTNAGQIVSGSAAYEIASPYAAEDLGDLQVYNDAGTLYIATPEHPPYRLVYASDVSWSLTACPFEWGPFRDMNDVETLTITPSALTGNITLTAAGGTPFITGASGHVGAQWLIGHRVGEASLIHTFTGVATSATIAVAKGASWKISTSGAWNGTLALEKSYDGAAYETVSTFAPAEDNNWDAPGDEVYDDATYRLRMTSYTSGSAKATFTVDAHIAYGYVTITAVTTTALASATVVETLKGTAATNIWAEGSWSPYRGYPRGVGLVDNRLTFVGTLADPTTGWMSHTNRYMDMRTGSAAADALIFTFTTGRGDPFLWILGQEYQFYIGTPSAILQIAAADPRSSISASNPPGITRRIQFGSSCLLPVEAFSTMILMDAAGLRPMKVQYDWQRDLLFSPPLNLSCPTITDPGIKKVVFQRGRVPIVWFLRTDGRLAGMTFEQLETGEDIKAWHIHHTNGEIEDIDCLPGGSGDTLWWIAARTVDGATQRHVEQLDDLDLKATRASAHRLDAYVAYTGGAAKVITGIVVNGSTGRVTITAANHGFVNGDHLDFAAVGGMTWLNGQTLIVADATTHTFTLKTVAGAYVNGLLLTLWTSGGRVRKVAKTFTGLGHLEGLAVYAVADGAVKGPITVSAGQIPRDGDYGTVYVGLDADAFLQPLRLVVPTPGGSTRGRQIRTNGLWISVYRSWECEIGPEETHLSPVRFWDTETEVNAAPELVTRDFYQNVECGYSADPTVVIKAPRGLPLCVRAMMLDLGVAGTRAGKTA